MGYPFDKDANLKTYARRHFDVSNTARHLYESLWGLEQDNGFCKEVIADYREIARQGAINKNTVESALMALQSCGLCVVTKGSPIKNQRTATKLRRRTVEELQDRSRDGEGDAHVLARSLIARDFTFNKRKINPQWTVTLSGRVTTSKPNFQGLTGGHPIRFAGLKTGLRKGECLVYADIKSAEPTVIKHLLRFPFEFDIYSEYAKAANVTRVAAKDKMSALHYCADSLAVFSHFPEAVKQVLGSYVDALAKYKAKLRTDFDEKKSVATLSGRSIARRPNSRVTRGHVLNWQAQGTIADIINPTCLELIADRSPLVLPVHDAIYAVTVPDKAKDVESIIVRKACALGLKVKVETEVFTAE